MAAVTRVIADYELGLGGRLYIGEIDLDASYPSGGYPIDLPKNTRVEILLTDSHGGYTMHWNRDTQLLQVQRVGASFSNPQAEVTGGVSLATVTKIPFLAIGS